jgi:hypothetical protein
MRAPVEGGVDAQIAAEFDAGVGARNIEEACAIEGADTHILDRFRLDRQIGCPGATHGEKGRRGTENKVSYRCHY